MANSIGRLDSTRGRRGERGASLVLVLSLMLLLTFLATSLLFTSDVEFKTGKNYLDNLTTLADADSAVAEVLWRLNLTQGAAAPPAGSTISVNSLSSFDAKINPDPFGLLTNEIDDDLNGTIDDPNEIKYMRDWQARILLNTTEVHPGSPWEIADGAALSAPWGPTLVTPTIQPVASWRLYTVPDASSADVLSLRYKLDRDFPTVGDAEGDGDEPVFYSSRILTNGRDDRNSLNQLGGNGVNNDDTPYNITYTNAGVTTWAKGSPVLVLNGVSRILRAGKEVGRRKFEVELYYPVRPVMTKALCSCGYLDTGGNARTDSYRSSEGDYSASGTPHYDNGDIGSNTGCDAAATIRGDAECGGNITNAGSVSGDATAGGTISGTPGGVSEPGTLPVPAPCECSGLNVTELVDDAADPASARNENAEKLSAGCSDLSLDADCTLPAGSYYFTSININTETVTITGPVTIYLDGDISLNGNGGFNVLGPPAWLKIIVKDGDIRINGGHEFHGVIYAPNSDAQLNGSADINGAVLARNIEFRGDHGVHFDEDLADVWSVRDTYRVLNWKETD